jgi:hypothetical protein
MTEIVIFCPKCDSENVQVTRLTEPRKIRTPMGKPRHLVPLVYYMITYRGVCRDCKYTKEWTE